MSSEYCKDYSKKASKFDIKGVEKRVRDKNYQSTSFETGPGALDAPVKASPKRPSDSGSSSY